VKAFVSVGTRQQLFKSNGISRMSVKGAFRVSAPQFALLVKGEEQALLLQPGFCHSCANVVDLEEIVQIDITGSFCLCR
jgi:hypothetical protein